MKYKDCLTMFEGLEAVDETTKSDITYDSYRLGDYKFTFVVSKGEVLMINIWYNDIWDKTLVEPTEKDIDNFLVSTFGWQGVLRGEYY